MKENAISDLADKCKVLKTYFGGEHLEDEDMMRDMEEEVDKAPGAAMTCTDLLVTVLEKS